MPPRTSRGGGVLRSLPYVPSQFEGLRLAGRSARRPPRATTSCPSQEEGGRNSSHRVSPERQNLLGPRPSASAGMARGLASISAYARPDEHLTQRTASGAVGASPAPRPPPRVVALPRAREGSHAVVPPRPRGEPPGGRRVRHRRRVLGPGTDSSLWAIGHVRLPSPAVPPYRRQEGAALAAAGSRDGGAASPCPLSSPPCTPGPAGRGPAHGLTGELSRARCPVTVGGRCWPSRCCGRSARHTGGGRCRTWR